MAPHHFLDRSDPRGLMVAGWLGVVLGASGLVVVAVSARRKAVIAGGR